MPEPRSSQEPQVLTPGEVLRVSWKHRRLLAGVLLGSLFLGSLYAFFWPPTYEARVSVKVPDSSQTAFGIMRTLSPGGTKTGDPLETFLQMVESDNVALRVIETLHLRQHPEFQELDLEKLVRKLERSIQVVDVRKSNLFDIQVRSKDAALAADLANAFADSFIRLNLDLSHQSAASRRKFLEEQTERMRNRARTRVDELVYGQLNENLQNATLEENTDDTGIYVIDRAFAPSKPIRPKKALSLLLALMLGLAAALQAAFLVERTRDRVEDEKRLKALTGLPNYALIPNFREDYPAGMDPPDPKERFNVKALVHNPVFAHSHYSEGYKVLRTNLTLAQAGKAPRVLSVISCNPEEGKTLTNSNLAITLAQGGQRTLLVGADLRKPSLSKMFALPPGPPSGLALALTGQGDWKAMVRPSGIPGLDLLVNSVIPPNPAELLGSPAMGALVTEFRKAYDWVIFDAPPILPVTDSALLSHHLDGVILLVRWNFTRVPELSKALELLHAVHAPLLGTVLNDVRLKEGLYGYGGYGYGKYVYGPGEKS